MSESNQDVFKKLALHLDKMPIGYPPTESGVEIKVLQSLFTPLEAEIASVLNFAPDSVKKIHKRVKKIKIPIDKLETTLDKMYFKGLINRGSKIEDGEEVKFYSSAPLALGFFEYQVNKLTPDFLQYFEKYYEEAFIDELNKSKIPQLRTIPIEKSLTIEQNVSTYDELRSVIDNSDGIISVANCVCRQGEDLKGNPCKKTEMRELCFQFRSAAKSYLEKGQARQITKEEAYEILQKAEDAGLVIQPGNSQRPMAICCCCGCCCEVLKNQKKLESPAQFFATNFYAEVSNELCVGCGTCVDRCNMDALSVDEEVAIINLARCIGCGACVPSCPEEALSLKKKQEEVVPPKNTIGTYIAIMDKKAELARMKK